MSSHPRTPISVFKPGIIETHGLLLVNSKSSTDPVLDVLYRNMTISVAPIWFHLYCDRQDHEPATSIHLMKNGQNSLGSNPGQQLLF